MNLLKERAPEVFDAYMGVIRSLEENCPVEPRVRELILIGILTATGSIEGLGRHVERALVQGATKDEIITAVISPLPITGVRPVLQGLDVACPRLDNLKEDTKDGARK